jgi:hypothetical protein
MTEMFWYLLKRGEEFHFTFAPLSALRGYEKKVKGYETWEILAKSKTEKGIENKFLKLAKSGVIK